MMTVLIVALRTTGASADAAIAVEIHVCHFLQLTHQATAATAAMMRSTSVAALWTVLIVLLLRGWGTVLVVLLRIAARTTVGTTTTVVRWTRCSTAVLVVLRRIALRSVLLLWRTVAVSTSDASITVQVHVRRFLELVHQATSSSTTVTLLVAPLTVPVPTTTYDPRIDAWEECLNNRLPEPTTPSPFKSMPNFFSTCFVMKSKRQRNVSHADAELVVLRQLRSWSALKYILIEILP